MLDDRNSNFKLEYKIKKKEHTYNIRSFKIRLEVVKTRNYIYIVGSNYYNHQTKK